MPQDMTRETVTDGRPDLGPRPEWAKAVIVAELEEDRSEIMTDYHATTTTKTVPLAWSRHERDLFPELRKAAALYAPTSHLGPGKGVFVVRVIFDTDVRNCNGRNFYQGDYSGSHGEPEYFDTRDDAEAWIAYQPELSKCWYGETLVSYSWQIQERPIEHREKYSMGHGYYLKASCRYSSGWRVVKHSLNWFGTNLETKGE